MKNENLVFHGSYFKNNFGDTLLVKNLIEYFIDSYDNSIFLALKPNRKERDAITQPVYDYKLDYSLIYSGGGYLGENAGKGFISKQIWGLRNTLRHYVWRSFKKKPNSVSYICVGFGPITSPIYRYFVMRDLERAKLIIFRDKKSQDIYKSYGGKNKSIVLCDFVLISEIVSKINITDIPDKKKKINLGLHFQNSTMDHAKKICNFLSKYLKESSLEYNLSLVFDTESRKDNQYIELVERIIGTNFTICKYEGLDKCKKVISSQDVIITTKLHVGIVGITNGVRVISLPTHTKTYRLFEQLGLADYCLLDDKFNYGYFLSAFTNIYANYHVNYEYIEDSKIKLNSEINRVFK